MISYLIHYDSLLRNPRDSITKCDIGLPQNATEFLLQKCSSYIGKCNSYYKMWRLLQTTSVEASISRSSFEFEIIKVWFWNRRSILNWSSVFKSKLNFKMEVQFWNRRSTLKLKFDLEIENGFSNISFIKSS